MLKVEKRTEFYAIKTAIEEVVKYFRMNRDKYFVSVEIKHELGVDSVVVRREVLSMWIGFDFVINNRMSIDKFIACTRIDYFELWMLLKKHEEKNELLRNIRS